jgi:hypothetical protein
MAKSTFGKSAGGNSNTADLKREVAVLATIAYPSLTEPDQQSGKFGAMFLVDNDEPTLEALRELVLDHAEAVTGERAVPRKWHDPIRDGDEAGTNGGFAFKHPAFRGGKTVFRAKTNFAPTCLDGEARTPVEPGEIRGGDKVVVAVSAYSFNNQSAGVAFSLGGIWRVADGTEVIERGGGGGGASFQKFDASRIKFSRPRTEY